MDDWGDWRGGWEAQREFYRAVWRRTTPAERLQMLEQMRELARQTGALQRATDAKLAAARALWET